MVSVVKKVIILIILGLLPIIIYFINIDNKIYYLALGDSLAQGQNPYSQKGYGYSDYVKTYLEKRELLEFYTKDYAKDEERIIDLIRAVKDNEKIIKGKQVLTLKNALTNADLVTLSIGMNDLSYKLNNSNLEIIDSNSIYLYIDEMMEDLKELFLLLGKYCKEDIFVLNYYIPPLVFNNDELIKFYKYANQELKMLVLQHNLIYVDLEQCLNDLNYFPNLNNRHPNLAGYKLISEKIIKLIEEKVL